MKKLGNFLLAAALIAALAGVVCVSARAAEPVAAVALVTRDAVTLRAAPRESAAAQTVLWRGEALEIRAERGDYLQVWDHQRERGGYVLRSQLLRVGSGEKAAPELLALLGFVSEQPGSETLGLALAVAAIQAMPVAALQGPDGARVLDAIGRQAERLAERASQGAQRAQDRAQLTAHLDVARRHGVVFQSVEDGERVRLCYEGGAHHRLLAMPAASAEQQARAALALTRPECRDSHARPSEREAADQARAALLDRAGTTGLSTHSRARLATRQASVWSSLAFTRALRGDAVQARQAAERALTAIARVDRSELADDDLVRYTEVALRANAVRWAAGSGVAPAAALTITTRKMEDGQTCARLIDPRQKNPQPLAERCSWGVVWAASASVNREGNAAALAVQPLDGWRELWVFRKTGQGWTVQVMPPAALNPGLGYAEVAGWVPGGRQMLVAREAIAEGRNVRRFEVVELSTLTPQRTAFEPDALGPFARWPDAAWKRDSLALR
jgi:hypothetical protein